MLDLDDIENADLSQLTPMERRDLIQALEVMHKDKRKGDIVEYAAHIEVPGAPSKMNLNDRQKMLARKAQIDMLKINSGAKVEIPEYDFEKDEVDEGEFYPKQLDIPEHGAMILSAVQGMMEEMPVEGPLTNGHQGIVPDGIMFFFSPGSAKSTYASVIAPTYVMGRFPGTDVIGTSYGSELAKRFGRRVRSICRSDKYAAQWDTQLTGDNQAVDAWSLMNGSTYRAVGILGGVTGNRADLLIIDDPIAGREEAESEIIREKTNAAMKDDLFTRLKPGGKVLLIQTRWHEDDPAGHLLGEKWEGQSGLWRGTDGRWWLVFCCPLICDALDDPLNRRLGERMWPQWFTDRYVELARAMGERAWNSLYQQKPAASEGIILLRKYWKCWPHGKPDPTQQQKDRPGDVEPPEHWAQCWLVYDTAFEDGQDNDYSAMTAWVSFTKEKPGKRQIRLKDSDDKTDPIQQQVIMLGAWRGKVKAVDLFDIVKQHVKFFRPEWVIVEKKASGIQLLQELRRERSRYVDEQGLHYPAIVEWLPPFPPGANGKVPRAHAASVVLASGSVWYLPGPMTAGVIKECAAFPNGKHDDWTDTVTSSLIWSRNVNLLDRPSDKLDKHEKEDLERGEFDRRTEGRGLYGRSTNKKTRHVPRLYGRSVTNASDVDDDDGDDF